MTPHEKVNRSALNQLISGINSKHCNTNSIGYTIYDMYDAREFILAKSGWDDIFSVIFPDRGFHDVVSFKRSLELIYNRGLVKGLSLSYINRICDVLMRLEQRTLVHDDNYGKFMRAVLRASMKVAVFYVLLNIDKHVKLTYIIPRSFKCCYTLFSSDLTHDFIRITNTKEWLRAYTIVVNACLKRRTSASRVVMNQIRNYTEILQYLESDKYVDYPECVWDGIFSRGTMIYKDEIMSEYRDYVMMAWNEMNLYKENPNWY